MSLTTEMASDARKRETEAQTKLTDLARREARGETTKGDVKLLAELLPAASWTAARYSELVAIFKQAADLEAKAACGSTLRTAEKAARDLAMHDQETQASLMKRAKERQVLADRLQNAEIAAKDARWAAAQLDLLKWEHPGLFPDQGVDLDAFTLTCGNSVITVSDPAAPEREVPREIFDRETERRAEIYRRASVEAAHAYRQRLAKWWKQQGRITSPLAGPQPKEQTPAWGEIIASGRLAELESEDWRPRVEASKRESQDEQELVGMAAE